MKNITCIIIQLNFLIFCAGCNLPDASYTNPPIRGDFSQVSKKIAFKCDGRPFNYAKYAQRDFILPQLRDPYALIPRTLLDVDQNDSSYAIAWYDQENKKVKITLIDSDDQRVSTEDIVIPGENKTCDFLAGFDLLNSEDFYVAYGNHPSDSDGGRLYIAKVVKNTRSIEFENIVFEGRPLSEELLTESPANFHSPLYKGTSRLSAAKVLGSDKICLYYTYVKSSFGKDDEVRDSAVYLNSNGMPSTDPFVFYSSKNTHDVRIIYDNEDYCMTALTLDDPSGIVFQKATSSTSRKKLVYPFIEGVDQNTISFQLSDVLSVNTNSYIATSTTSLNYDISNQSLISERSPRFDVVLYSFNGTTGRITDYTALTRLDSSGNTSNPKIAPYKNSSGTYLVGWNIISTQGNVYADIRIIQGFNRSDKFSSKTIPKDIIFDPASSFSSFPNGDVGFVVSTNDSLKVYRVLNR